MKNLKKVFKLFYLGQEEKECKWLKEMSKEGYHLLSVSFACYYTFEKGEPKDYEYVIDMKESISVDNGEYLAIYQDCGLEYIDTTKNFYYFRGSDIESVSKLKNDETGRYLDRLNIHKKVLLMVSIMNIGIGLISMVDGFLRENIPYNEISYVNLILGLCTLFIYYKIKEQIKSLKNKGISSHYTTTIKDWGGLYPIFIICIVLVVIYSILTLLHFFIN